jgi:hypothetical protein
MDPNRFNRRLREPLSPQPPPAPPASAFVMIPTGFFFPVTPDVAQWQQALYQWAYNQAQELNKPSLFERDWLGVWN